MSVELFGSRKCSAPVRSNARVEFHETFEFDTVCLSELLQADLHVHAIQLFDSWVLKMVN